ncbi:MAG: hypothetical protein ACTHMQ_02065 [Protaetiibacter sp.]
MRVPEFLRISLSPLVRVLLVLSVPVTVIGMGIAVDDPDGDQLWGHVMIAPPLVIGCVAILEVVWRRLPINRVLEGFRRILVVPTAAGLVTGITTGIAYAAWGIGARVTDPYHHWFPPETGNPGVLTFVSGTALGMFVALFAFMVVAAPLLTLVHADEFIAFNYGELEEGQRGAARGAVRCIGIVVACVVLAPGGFLMDWPVLGWVATAVGLAATTATVALQRRIGRSPI